MRHDVTFPSEGLNCAGWLYVPDDLKSGERRPTIVMAHGFSAVKEMYLDRLRRCLSLLASSPWSLIIVIKEHRKGQRAGVSSLLSNTRTIATQSPGSPCGQKWTPRGLACGARPIVERMSCTWPHLISGSRPPSRRSP